MKHSNLGGNSLLLNKSDIVMGSALYSIFKHLDGKNMLAGMVAGVTSTMILHPLELIKVRMQVDDTAQGHKSIKKTYSSTPTTLSSTGPAKQQSVSRPRYSGVFNAFKVIYTESGIRGLYQGVTPNIWGSGASWGIYFFLYAALKSMQIGRFTNTDDLSSKVVHLPAYVHLLNAFVAGSITSLITNPIWMMKTRLCLQYNKDKYVKSISDPSGKALIGINYNGMLDGLYKVIKYEGFMALYKGLSFGILGTLHGVVQFGVYEQLKQHHIMLSSLFSYHTNAIQSNQLKQSMSANTYAVYSGISKIAAVLLTYPFQLIRSRLQDQHSQYASGRQVIQLILVNEGIFAFYKGITATLIRVVPASCITFVKTRKIAFTYMNYLKLSTSNCLPLWTKVFSRNLTVPSAFDVCVIGSGPGGYVAAIKAAQLGLKTVCVEKDNTLGGTCLNVGCIPSKSLLHNSHLFHMAKSGQLKSRGINCQAISLDLKTMMSQKELAVKGLTHGVSMLFKSNNITRIQGVAKIANIGEIQVTDNKTNTNQTIKAKHIIIATGSTVTHIPGIQINERNIVSSTGALSLNAVPNQMLVIGAGVIGLELGSVWSRLGSKVTVIEMLDSIGGLNIDKEVSTHLLRILKRQGLQFRLESKVEQVQEQPGGTISVKCSSKKGTIDDLNCDVLLVCAGRRPYCDNLGLEELGVQKDNMQRVVVNDNFQTNIENIYAIGDCIRGPMLAHKSEDEGIMCAEYIAHKKKPHLNYDNIPNVIYTHPEVAWVGKGEETLKAEGKKYKIGKFPMIANSRAKTIGESDGFCKILSDVENGQLLGAHMINVVAGDLITEAVLAMDHGITCEQISESCHPHPTCSEAFKEANLHAFSGKTINNIN
ncbi:hypothetical protein GJ496_007544 [Pomphorhynchus laevis]|nr:hypothetical protein GJ496_007544 [Pomphorhynchus laevis]